MEKVYFVSGIDTGIGKTVATGMIARFLLGRGVRAATVKMVQTGCRGFSEDLELHRKLMGIPPLPEDLAGLTCPAIFEFPASPHFAAALEGRAVEPERIAEAVRLVAPKYDVTLVEGAGGLAVPLTENLLTVDFAAGRNWPVLLVASGRLGSLNHILLSLEALHARKMRLAGAVWNYCADADCEIDADSLKMTEKYLARYGFAAPVVRLGRVDVAHPEMTEADFSPLFPEVMP